MQSNMFRNWCGWALLIFCAASLTSCTSVSPIYEDSNIHSGRDFVLTPKSTWTATGTIPSPSKAIDGRVDTAAVAPTDYTGKFITIDLKKACTLDMIAMDHGSAVDGYPRLVEVAISMDGTDFQPVYNEYGTRRITTLLLPRPVLARYVRLRAVRAGIQPWSIAEINIQ